MNINQPKHPASLSVAVPIFNAAEFIRPNLEKLSGLCRHIEIVSDVEFILVDDGSTDGSGRLVDKFEGPDTRVFHQANKGLGSVFKLILERYRGDLLLLVDADLSYDISLVPEMIRLACEEELDCVVASKYITPNSYPLHRRLASWLYTVPLRIVGRLPIRDIGSGLILFSRKILHGIKLYSSGFAIHAELFLAMRKKHAKMLELPCRFHHRPGSFSLWKHGPRTIIETLTFLSGK